METYNKAHNTDFALYPQDLVTFANEGILTVNANTKSAEVEMTIRAGEGLQEDKTYAIPVAISIRVVISLLKMKMRNIVFIW